MNQKEIKNITIQLFKLEYNKPQPRKDAPELSVDVFILDKDGLHGLAFFSFKEEKWYVHTDTFVGYMKCPIEANWMWYYPPVNSW